jgi:uncharacterized MAPEG superfamily protein
MLLSQWALVGFALWTLSVVLFSVGFPRISAILRGEAKPSSFDASVPHGSERYRRSMRAHANCVDNLPIFASLVLLGSVLGMSGELFQITAFAVLPARILQSVAHIASGRSRAALVRFVFFSVQLVAFALMGGLLVARGLR